MAELEKLVSDILGDPETGEKLKSMLSGSKELSLPDSLDADMMLKMTKAMSAMNGMKDDSRTKLLYDLKPYISGKRCKRVDEAVQILKLIKVIDIMGKEQ